MKNKLLREANAVVTIAMRDIVLCLKSPGKLIQCLIMPIMFLGMFGGQLSQNMGMNMGFDFNTFMLVGMLVQGIFMIMGTGIVPLVEDRVMDFSQEILVSPVSRYSILPMTYCVDFMRGVFYQSGDVSADGGLSAAVTLHSPVFNLAIIATFTALFLIAGTAGFVRAEKNK